MLNDSWASPQIAIHDKKTAAFLQRQPFQNKKSSNPGDSDKNARILLSNLGLNWVAALQNKLVFIGFSAVILKNFQRKRSKFSS